MGNSTSYTVNIKALFDAGDVLAKIKNILTTLNNLKLPDNLRSNFNSTFNELNKALEDFLTKSRLGIKSKGDSTAINKSFDRVVAEMEKYDLIVQKIRSLFSDLIDLSNWIKIDDSVKLKLEGIKKEIADFLLQLNNLNASKVEEVKKVIDLIKSKGARGKAEESFLLFNQNDLLGAIKLLDLAIAKLKTLLSSKTDSDGNTVYNFNEQVRLTATTNILALERMREVYNEVSLKLQEILDNIGLKLAEGLLVATLAAQELQGQMKQVADASTEIKGNIEGVELPLKDATTNAGLFASELDLIKNRIQYFFGLANAINLVKRAIRSSFNTVKELDKAMTETAVVTNYTIKDMWKLLPEYTKRANQLGVTTKEAYESATLYYQLGLNTELAAALSTETLKMARIAGLDAADATDRMTNALRGFNMELNATLAQRVDDVYSQLAAMSASNVDEISTAMTKVASLANNANMEFETTAAFLAQIIESTRESAETAGTALKTVVARFSEVKKLYDKEELKGQDEEGQIIDVNKVSAALRTAGIDLNKYFLGEVGLDDIFIELASKWDSLTNIQLRYIATLAAGSRQQSRFIALMADYKRTQELVGAAYNSTGASEKQFEKTQDSMQSKLARLKNAWDEFAMGLANNAVLKGVVDALTTLLLVINKVTSAFGDGAGSILKWVAAISALSGVRKAFMGGGFVDKAVGTFLNGTQLGKTLFKKGTLSGFLFGGKTANGSQAEQEVLELAVNGGTRTTIRTGGLFNNLFNGNLKKKIADFKKENANLIPKIIELGTDDTTGRPITDTAFIPSPENTSLFAALGNKFTGTKIGGAISNIPTHFGGTALSGAATLGVTLGAVAAAAAAAYAAYRLWERFSPEGQLKQATLFSLAMDLAAESALKAKESTKLVYDTYTEKDKAVEEASSISERNKAIEDRNTYVNELLQLNDSYAKYLKTEFKDGLLLLTLDKDALKNVANEAEKAAAKTAIGANLAKAMLSGKQANVYRVERQRAGVLLEEGTIRDYDEEGKAYQRLMTDKELAKYTDLEVKASERDKVMRGFAKSAYSLMIDGEALGDEFGELVAGALAEGFDENEYYESIKDLHGGTWWNWMRSRSHWQEEYLKAYGVEADSSMKTADIARAVALKGALNLLEANAAELSELVKSNKEAYEPLLKAINGTFDGKVKLDTDASALIDDLTKGINLEAFADAIGKTPEELKTILESNIKAQKEIYANNIKNLALKGLKAGASRGFFSLLLSMNPDQVADLFGFADAAEKSLGDGFTNFLDNLDVSLLDSYKEFFSGFDLDEPLQAVKKLNEAINDKTNPTIQALATNIKKVNLPLFDTGYLTLFFMTSEAYEGISESLEKFIEDNEEITADNIEELAKSCSELKTLLDETDTNAQGLARAFTAVASGEASIDGITSAVLETLGATLSANTAIDKLFKSIDEFDAGRDFGKAIDFANSKIEELEKSLENLDFGNETFKKNYEYLFSSEQYEDFIKLDTAGRKEALEGLITKIKELLDNDALGAMRALSNIGDSGVEDLGTGFDFTWDVGSWTWDDAVKEILGYLDVNELIASSILTAAAKHIPGLTELLDLNGFERDITLFNLKISELALVTEQELLVLAQAYGKEVDELWKDLQDNAKKNEIDLPARISWQDDDGNNLTGKELLDKARLTYNTAKFKIDAIRSRLVYDDDGYETMGGFDPTKLTTAILNSLKVNAALAREIANDYVKSVNGLFELPVLIPYKVVNEDGSETWDLKTEIAKGSTLEELEALVKLKEDQALWAAYGEAMKTAITTALGDILPTGNADTIISNIETLLAGHTFTVNVKGNYVGTDGAPGSDSTDNTSRGNAPEKHADGGIVPSHAKGTKRIKPGVALTGEEGPELVWNKQGGYAYLVGKNGPEFADLVPGDLVFPADETKDIIRRGVTPSLAKGGKVVPAYDGGSGSWKDLNGGKNNGDGDKKKEDTEGAKLNLDKYYNLVEDINELLRLRNLLEKDYELLLKNEGKTGKEIYDNLTRQLDLLEERRKIVEDLALKRKQLILDLVEENKEYGNYAWWNDSDQTIEIDWDAVQKVEDKDTASALKEYLSKLEDFLGKYDDMIEQLEEIESNVQEIRKRGKEQYDTLEERTRDALIKQIQDKIDELTEVDKAINDTNQKLFDSMQDTLQKQRQERDNAKTEGDLTDKEKRLAYLQLDSSNANALEIAKLQEELADARQDYTDNLIDLKISELLKLNDEAQELRQEQIDLMLRSLDWQEKSGAFWDTVYKYISEGTDEIGTLVHGSELENLLKSAEPWDKLSEELKKTWVNELLDLIAQGIAYLELTRLLEDVGTKEGTKISFTTAGEKLTGALNDNGEVELEDSSGKKFKGEDIGGGTIRFTDEDGNIVGYGRVNKEGKVEFLTAGLTLNGTVDKNGNVVVTNPDGSTVTYKDVFLDYNGAYRTFETEGEAKLLKKPVTNTTSGSGGSGGSGSNGTGTGGNVLEQSSDELLDEYYYPASKETCMLVRVWKLKGEVRSARGHVRETINHGGDYSTVQCKNCGLLLETSYNKYGVNDSDYSSSGELGAEALAPDPAEIRALNRAELKIEAGKDTAAELLKTIEEETEDRLKKRLYDIFSPIGDALKRTGMFETGGLADFTGPAWLDGTKSHPELVLNARDTQNFIELKDTLAEVRKAGALSLNGGDNYYDIKVQVDSLSSDYDVDRAIDRIKARIAQDGAYRNVNTLSRLR